MRDQRKKTTRSKRKAEESVAFSCTRCGPVSVMHQVGWTANGSPACKCLNCGSAVIGSSLD